MNIQSTGEYSKTTVPISLIQYWNSPNLQLLCLFSFSLPMPHSLPLFPSLSFSFTQSPLQGVCDQFRLWPMVYSMFLWELGMFPPLNH